jgi:hypothetical protein
MVKEVKCNGRLALTQIGGFMMSSIEGECCEIHTRDGKVFEGTIQTIKPSVHIHSDARELPRTVDNYEVVIDREVFSKEDTNKLGRILAEAYLLIGKEAKNMLPSENLTLSNAISFIAESNKNNKNISNFSDASKIIKEHIKTNGENKNMFESKNLDELAKNLINEFNAKYSNEFSDEEISVLKEVSCSNNREDVFIKYKTNCINKIIEAKHNFESKGDKTSSERLNTILEQVSNKYFALESVGSDICSLIQLTKIFE